MHYEIGAWWTIFFWKKKLLGKYYYHLEYGKKMTRWTNSSVGLALQNRETVFWWSIFCRESLGEGNYSTPERFCCKNVNESEQNQKQHQHTTHWIKFPNHFFFLEKLFIIWCGTDMKKKEISEFFLIEIMNKIIDCCNSYANHCIDISYGRMFLW